MNFTLLPLEKDYSTIEEIQAELDPWLHYYDHERPTSGTTVLVRLHADLDL